MMMATLTHQAQRALRTIGLDVARIDPDRSPGIFLSTLFQHFGITCVLDVGAHFGEFGRRIRRAGYQGDLISFEPVASNFGRLQETCKGDPKWRAEPLALGSENGVATINLYCGNGLHSFHQPSAYGTQTLERLVVDGSQQVEVRRLDSILDQYVGHLVAPRVFLKLDTQGWDLEVLRGATGCLGAICALQTELAVKPLYEGMPSYVEALDHLGQMGFELSTMFPVFRDQQLRVVELDCVLVRTSTPGEPRELHRDARS